jgi:hypothetical protein
VRGPLSLPPRFPLWAEPSHRPGSRERRAFPFSLWLMSQAHMSGSPSSSPRWRRIPFLVHHRPNPPPQSLSSLFRAPPGYIFWASAPLRSILPRSRGPSSSRGDHTRDIALAARLSEPRVFLVSSSASIWPFVSSHWCSLSSVVLLSRARALYRKIAKSGLGAIAEPTVGLLLRPERRPAFPRSDLERSNQI